MSLATPGDERKLKEMIMAFYAVAGHSPPQQLKINDNVASVFMAILHEAAKCTKSMNYIPLPLGQKISSRSGLVLWVATYVWGAVFDSFSKKLDYKCVSWILNNWSSRLDMAGRGL